MTTEQIADKIVTHMEARAMDMTEAEFAVWAPAFMAAAREAWRSGITECWKRANGVA